MNAPRRAFIATLATAIASLATGAAGPQDLDWLPDRFEKPVLALELVRTPSAFAKLIDQYDRRPPFTRAADTFARNTRFDFALIAAYTSMWILILRQRRGTICTGGIVLVVIAAAADVVEDLFIFRSLRTPGADAAMVADAAIVKWAALAIAFGAVAYRFWPDREVRDGWQLVSAAIALLYVYAGVLCLVGVLFSNPVIERAALPLAVAFLMQMALFWHERHTTP
jgi:hypothetical protein